MFCGKAWEKLLYSQTIMPVERFIKHPLIQQDLSLFSKEVTIRHDMTDGNNHLNNANYVFLAGEAHQEIVSAYKRGFIELQAPEEPLPKTSMVYVRYKKEVKEGEKVLINTVFQAFPEGILFEDSFTDGKAEKTQIQWFVKKEDLDSDPADFLRQFEEKREAILMGNKDLREKIEKEKLNTIITKLSLSYGIKALEESDVEDAAIDQVTSYRLTVRQRAGENGNYQLLYCDMVIVKEVDGKWKFQEVKPIVASFKK